MDVAYGHSVNAEQLAALLRPAAPSAEHAATEVAAEPAPDIAAAAMPSATPVDPGELLLALDIGPSDGDTGSIAPGAPDALPRAADSAGAAALFAGYVFDALR